LNKYLGKITLMMVTVLIPVCLIMALGRSETDKPLITEDHGVDCQGLPAQESPWQEETYIIFLSGLESHCDGTPYGQMGFSYMRRNFTQAGFLYYDPRFLMYSYKGGQVRAGRWYPNPYNPIDTGQPLEFSILYLKEMIDEIALHRSRARFLLVGHSLGGRIAFDYINRYHNKDGNGPVKGVITLNSPLTGLPYNAVGILGIFRPAWGSDAVKQLVAEYRLQKDFDLIKLKTESARRLMAQKIHLATFGTRQDMVVNPDTACLIDNNGRPLIPGKIISVNIFSGGFNELFGHRQILYQENIADYIMSVYNCPG